VYCSLIHFKRDRLKRNFGQHRYLQLVLKFRSPSSVLQKFKFLASSTVQVPICSRLPDVILSACLLRWTQCHVHTLLKYLHDLHGLLRTWPVRLHRRSMWNASFLSVGCYILDDE